MKKFLAALVVLTMVIAMSAMPAMAASDASGTFTFYFWDENQKGIMQDVVALFNEDVPNVAVEITVIPFTQYWTKLQTSLSSETGPDVFWCNKANAIEYMPRNLIEPLDSYIEKDAVDMSVFPDALKALYSYDGKTYGIPKDYDTIGLFYNKALFDAKGIAYPTNDWTWKELEENAALLTGDGVHGFGVDLTSAQGCAYDFIIANGGTCMSEDNTMYDFSSPAAVGAFEYLMSFVKNGYAPTGSASTEIAVGDRFQAGLCAMTTAGSWNINLFQEALGADNVGVVAIPAGTQEGNVIHGLGICISAASAKKDLAWPLVKEFASAEAAQAQAKVVIPAHNAGGEVWAASFGGMDVSALLDAAQYATPIPTATVATAAQNDIRNSALTSIFLEEDTVENICAGLAAKFQAAKDAA